RARGVQHPAGRRPHRLRAPAAAPHPAAVGSAGALAQPQAVAAARRGMWWRREDSNLRHGAYETPALPPELRRLGRNFAQLQSGILTRPIAGARRIVPGARGVRTPARTWRAGSGAAAPPPGGA